MKRPARSPLLLAALVGCAAGCAAGDRAATIGAPWRDWTPRLTIGDSTAGSFSEIGAATGAAITARGDVVILDGAERRLVAFDSVGVFGARTGANGDGPGEFRDPVGLALLAGDSIAVADRTHRRISIFDPPSHGLGFTRSVVLDFTPAALCAMRGDLFVVGMRQGMYLHRFAGADAVRESFSPVAAGGEAESQDPARAMRRFELGGGRLLCDAEGGLIVHVPEQHGLVHGIAPDGALRWTYPIDSFALPVRTPRPAGGIRLDLDPQLGYADGIASAALLGDGSLQLVVVRTYSRESGRPRSVTAIVMRLADGAIVARVPDPPTFAFVTTRTAAELVELPVPGVRLWQR